jgi:fructose-1-phosphate kinase PfkB-like protein
MVSAEAIKGVNDLLLERGIEQKPDERIADFVARGLGITAQQADVLLQAMHSGVPVDEAVVLAGIDPAAIADRDLLTRLARVVGAAIGHLAG